MKWWRDAKELIDSNKFEKKRWESKSTYLCFRPLSRVQSSKDGEYNEDEKQDQSVEETAK